MADLGIRIGHYILGTKDLTIGIKMELSSLLILTYTTSGTTSGESTSSTN